MFQSPQHNDTLQNFLNRPENLQTLRDNVKNLLENDINSLQCLLDVVQKSYETTPNKQITLEQQEQKKQKQSYLFSYLSQQNRQRSGNLTTLGHLTIKMIDFILEEQQKYHYILQENNRQIQQLKYTIEKLSCQNNIIAHDIQAFKSQLDNAEGQIHILLEEKQKETFHLQQISKTIQEKKDKQIEHLESQLQKLKQNLINLKHNHLLNKSNSKSNIKSSLKKNLSEARLFQKHRKRSTDVEHSLMLEVRYYTQINNKLVFQNQSLKHQIQSLKQKIKKHQQPNLLSENDLNLSTNNTGIISINGKQNLSNKLQQLTSLKKVLSFHSIHSIKQSQQKQIIEQQIVQNKKTLNTELSKKSFQNHFNFNSSKKLHFIHDQEFENNYHNTYTYYGQYHRNHHKQQHHQHLSTRNMYQSMIAQTNQTQNNSIKLPLKIPEKKKIDYKKAHYQRQARKSKFNKDYLNQSMSQSMILNNSTLTQRSSNGNTTQRNSIINNEIINKISQNTIFKAFSNFIVKNRIKRHSKGNVGLI